MIWLRFLRHIDRLLPGRLSPREAVALEPVLAAGQERAQEPVWARRWFAVAEQVEGPELALLAQPSRSQPGKPP